MGITGSAKIACKSLRGLSPLTGSSINCTLISGPAPKIRIENYQKINKGEGLFVVIPNVKNPRGTWKVKTSVTIKQNRIFQVISEKEATFLSEQNSQSKFIFFSFLLKNQV